MHTCWQHTNLVWSFWKELWQAISKALKICTPFWPKNTTCRSFSYKASLKMCPRITLNGQPKNYKWITVQHQDGRVSYWTLSFSSLLKGVQNFYTTLTVKDRLQNSLYDACIYTLTYTHIIFTPHVHSLTSKKSKTFTKMFSVVGSESWCHEWVLLTSFTLFGIRIYIVYITEKIHKKQKT